MNKKEKALRFLARSLEIDLENKGVAVTTEKFGAIAETHDGKLKAIVYPNDTGSVKIEGLRLPGIDIRVIDKNNPLHREYPKEAAYILTTYFKREGYDESISGSIFIDERGKFISYERCVKII